MTYLFLGEDSGAKEARLTELKEKTLPSKEAHSFDYEILFANKLDAETLKKALISLPAFSKQRLVVVKECHRLSVQNKELIADFVKNPPAHCLLVLDSDEADPKDNFIAKIQRFVKLTDFSKKTALDIFSLTRAIDMQKQSEALRILSCLLSEGKHPLQILGTLVWFWGKSRERLSSQRFKTGLERSEEHTSELQS